MVTARDRQISLQFVEKLPTGIQGLDLISFGGLPKNRSTLISGTAGSAKTVMAAQFLAGGIERGEAGVFVTFEEPPSDICKNMESFGWDIEQWERDGRWVFVDASPQFDEDTFVAGNYDLSALLARIEHAVRKSGASRVSLDSIGSLFAQFADAEPVRNQLFHVGAALRKLGVTSVMTVERLEEYGPVARYGVEEFVSDNVIILRNVLEQEKRRRTIEILKLRGTMHQKGEYPFTIIPDEGLVVLPLSAVALKERSSDERIPSGIDGLDEMCGGGFFRDSILLVSGATGTGKTLTSTHFIKAGAANDEKCVLFAFEESREQLIRNAKGWGIDFPDLEARGLLRVEAEYPGAAGLEDHLIRMKSLIEEFEPRRVVVDSLSALEHVSTLRSFREFVTGLTAYIKQNDISGLFTSTTPSLFGGPSITEGHISTITDSIILLRYVEMFGEMRRGITVLKMRGSGHDKDIREFMIDARGMNIGKAFRTVSGILSGTARAGRSETERLAGLFPSDGEGSDSR